MSGTSKALQKIARGTGIVFAGTVISMLFGFLSRAIIARYFSTEEYGVFNLALTVLSIALVVATLGFSSSLPREIAFYREKEPSRVDNLISTALIIVALNSLIWVTILFLEAGNISQVFKDARLGYALRIVVFTLPFWALTAVIISISRGFGRVREQVYFQNIVYPVLFLVFVSMGILFDGSFTSIFYAYLLAWMVTFIALLVYVSRDNIFKIELLFDFRLGKSLVRFSLPLLFTATLVYIMGWSDTLMLGYYKNSKMVGIYNAATPIARLLQIFMSSAAVIYPAIATSFYARDKIDEFAKIYQILTKWIFIMTFPLFSLILLFPEATIMFFFGGKYTSATLTLQILALGFMSNIFFGFGGWNLVIIGHTELDLLGSLLAIIVNISLNILLIPKYDIAGAATATMISYFVASISKTLWLYRRTKIHPFTENYIKLLIISLALLVLFKVLFKYVHFGISDIWHAIPVLVVFLVVYFILVLLSRTIDEDVELLSLIEKKFGIDLGNIKKILRRFS